MTSSYYNNSSGRPSTSSSFPCLIREILYAPNAPTESITHLLEVALTHHNSSHYQLAVQTYLRAQQEWYEFIRNKELKMIQQQQPGDVSLTSAARDREGEAIREAAPINDASRIKIPNAVYLFFRLAIGSVYESAGNDELALQQYMDAKRHAERFLDKEHPDRALPYASIAQIYFHLKQWELARSFFNRARELRVVLLGSEHVDTAVSYNNVAVCLHALGDFQEAIRLYNKAMIIFKQQLGINHPRTTVVQSNLTKTKSSFLTDFVLEDTQFGELYLPIEKKKTGKKKKGKKKGKKKKK